MGKNHLLGNGSRSAAKHSDSNCTYTIPKKDCHWVEAIGLMGWALFTEFRLGNFRLLHLARSEGLRSCPQRGVNYCMVQWVAAFNFTHTQEVLPVSRSILAKGAVVSDSMDDCRDFPFHFQETVVSSSRTIHRHSSSLDPYISGSSYALVLHVPDHMVVFRFIPGFSLPAKK